MFKQKQHSPKARRKAFDLKTIAALYVDPAGPYFGRPDCDPWDLSRDAKGYAGPAPIIAHPPCGPWSRLKHFCTKQDASLAPFALAQLAQYGGVLEHPAHSTLWTAFDLPTPFSSVPMLAPRGWWALEVEQVRWGHPARKRTWLLFSSVRPADLPPMPPARRPTHVVTSSKRGVPGAMPKLGSDQTHITPPAFAAWLISAVRSAFA